MKPDGRFVNGDGEDHEDHESHEDRESHGVHDDRDDSGGHTIAREDIVAVVGRIRRVGRTSRWMVHRLGRGVFGDRLGLTLFLGAVVFYALYWRVDVFIVDTFAVANTLVALADGHFYIGRVAFGPPDGATPGMHLVDGRLYGRNYGHAAFALLFLWGLEALAAVADLRIALAGLWSLALAAFAFSLGRVLDEGRESGGGDILGGDRTRPLTVVGCTVALAVFAANVALATDLPLRVLPLLALQLSTLVAAALLGVVAYRFLDEMYGRRVGAAAGVSTVLLGPVGFWASIPKRHVVTALLALLALYAFYRSRANRADELRFRALAYACVGLTAWVSAPEGLALFAALAPIDLFTGRRARRTLVVVGAAFLLALTPFFLTNLAIAGNPLQPPRMLPNYDGGGTLADVTGPEGGAGMAGESADGADGVGGAGGAGEAGGGDAVGSTGSSGVSDSSWLAEVRGVLVVFLGLLESASAAFGVFTRELGNGIAALDSRRLYHVFVRSGRIPGVDYSQTGGQTVELTLLESAPLLGVLLALPAVALARLRADTIAEEHATRATLLPSRSSMKFPSRPSMDRSSRPSIDPTRATDLFAVAYVGLFGLMYLPRLPLHATITVRYLVPTVPFLLYAVFRQEPVRAAVTRAPRLLAGLTAALVPVGCLLAAILLAGTSAGTAMQAHAVVNLAVAGLAAAWLAVAAHRDLDPRVGAAVLALTLAAMTTFLLTSGLEYFGTARQFALPLADLAEQLLPVR